MEICPFLATQALQRDTHWLEEWQSPKMRPLQRYSLVGGVAEPQDEATVKILIGWREREGEREGERGRAMEREGGGEIERPRGGRERERASD